MGDEVPMRGSSLKFQVAAADVAGLREVRLITRRGQLAKRWQLEGKTLLKTTHQQRRLSRQNRYFRLEVDSCDGRRAFSNPIYLR